MPRDTKDFPANHTCPWPRHSYLFNHPLIKLVEEFLKLVS